MQYWYKRIAKKPIDDESHLTQTNTQVLKLTKGATKTCGQCHIKHIDCFFLSENAPLNLSFLRTTEFIIILVLFSGSNTQKIITYLVYCFLEAGKNKLEVFCSLYSGVLFECHLEVLHFIGLKDKLEVCQPCVIDFYLEDQNWCYTKI